MHDSLQFHFNAVLYAVSKASEDVELQQAFSGISNALSVCFLKAPLAQFVWTVCFWLLWKQLISAPFHWSCAAHPGKARVTSASAGPLRHLV